MSIPASSKESSLPWVEKYRPKNMNEVASQGTVISVLRQSLQSDNLPHLLFYGPPGTGKTSTILALARELFGPTLFRSRILELNASDERGISVVREKVKNFAKVTVKETVPGYPCPPFKLIILDEADSLTSDAQTALRRTIEQYSRTTRFCLICNYVSRIIDPLTSRCAKFRFGAVDLTAGIDRLKFICTAEGVQFGSAESGHEEVLLCLMDRCGGDLRRAVTLLQGAHRLGQPLTCAFIDSLAGTIPTSLIETSLALVADPQVNVAKIQSFVMDTFARSALPPTQYLHQLIPHLMSNLSVLPTASQIQKALVLEKAAGVEARIGEGADEIVQILDFFMSARLILRPSEFRFQPSLL